METLASLKKEAIEKWGILERAANSIVDKSYQAGLAEGQKIDEATIISMKDMWYEAGLEKAIEIVKKDPYTPSPKLGDSYCIHNIFRGEGSCHECIAQAIEKEAHG